MKLLFALPGFHRFNRGAEVALLAVAGALARGGEEVTVVGSGPARPDEPYTYRRIPCIPRERWEAFPTFPPFRSETAWEDASFAAQMVLRVDLKQYDATVTCAFPFTHWGLRRTGSAGPAHFFVTQNGDWPALSDKAEFRAFSCAGLICTNPDYFQRNSQRWRCALIPNGVHVERFTPGHDEKSRFGLPRDKPAILMVSALIDTKRVLAGIRAVAQLENVVLVVAGDGPLRQDVTKLADELLPGRFHLVQLHAEEMPSLYRSVEVFLHLSLEESFGNVFLESWATGLPIVAHDSDRLRWILGDDQHLCDTTDEARLCGALRDALNRRGSSSRVGLERFSWVTVAEQYRRFISDTIEGANS